MNVFISWDCAAFGEAFVACSWQLLQSHPSHGSFVCSPTNDCVSCVTIICWVNKRYQHTRKIRHKLWFMCHFLLCALLRLVNRALRSTTAVSKEQKDVVIIISAFLFGRYTRLFLILACYELAVISLSSSFFSSASSIKNYFLITSFQSL